MSDDNELHKTLGALLQSSADIKDEVKYIHQYMAKIEKTNKEAIEKLEDKTVKKLEFHDTRLKNLEKKQYTILIIATAAWGIMLGFFRKLFQ